MALRVSGTQNELIQRTTAKSINETLTGKALEFKQIMTGVVNAEKLISSSGLIMQC